LRILGSAKAYLAPAEPHGPVGREEISGDDLDQSRLAGTVVADQADDLAWCRSVVDLGKREDGAVFHADAAQR